MTQLIISNDDFAKLKIQVLECIKDLREAGGPAACRFHKKLIVLVDDTEALQRNQSSSKIQINNVQQKLSETKSKVEDVKKKVEVSESSINSYKDEIVRYNQLSSELEETTTARNQSLLHMMKENDIYEHNIKAGPGWKGSQAQERDDLIKRIEKDRHSVQECKIDTQDVREQIIRTETKIKDNEKMFDITMKELRKIEESIEQSNTAFMEVQKQLHELHNRVEMLKLNLSQERDLLSTFKTDYKRKVMKRQAIEEKINKTHNYIDQYKKKLNEIVHSRCKIVNELGKQNEKNKDIDVQNAEKLCKLVDKRRDVDKLVAETENLIKKKELLSQKIVDSERTRVEIEKEKDELKMKLNKVVSVEMIVKKRENESQKRRKESLEREMVIVERKQGLCEKSSSTVLDLIHSSETTFKILSHDLHALQMNAREYQANIEALKEECNKHTRETEVASRSFDNALKKLYHEEEVIRNIHIKLENSELLLKQKQHLCEILKNECNARSKIVVINQEEIIRAKKEYNVVDRQINLIKVDITNIENDLVTEHFNHHHANEEREKLHREVEEIRNKINDVDEEMGIYGKEILQSHQSIQLIDKACDKYVKDYGTIVGYRDSIDNILLRKNEDLEKIQEKIKIQRSMLQHSASEYQGQITVINNLVLKLKNLTLQKKVLEDNLIIMDDLIVKCRTLESDIQIEKCKSLALKEELGLPFNIHRWRILELQHPAKFDKIQKIQKMQKIVIDTAELIAEKERSLRAVETSYFETKRRADRQPQLTEITQQANLYKAALDEKVAQMKNIEIDLCLTKKEVEQVKKTIKCLETERNRLKSEWIDAVTQN